MATTVQSQKYPDLQNYVDGRFVPADRPFLDVFDPSTGDLISKVPMSAAAEVDAAVRGARAALPKWSAMPIKERVQVFYRYKALLERDIDQLAALVTAGVDVFRLNMAHGGPEEQARARVHL